VFVFSPFGTFIVPPGFVWHTQLLLKAPDGGAGVIRLIPTVFQRAGQYKFSGRQRFAFSRSFVVSFTAVDGEQNGQVALLAANAEIPSSIGLGPSGNIQTNLTSSEMPELSKS